MTNYCTKCPHLAYMDGIWCCDAMDWAIDNEYDDNNKTIMVVRKYAVIDKGMPSPDWCPKKVQND